MSPQFPGHDVSASSAQSVCNASDTTGCHLTWSVVSSSAAFSAFSAVLAGLMFAGMVLLLTRELREYRASSPTTGLHRPIGGQFASWVDPFMARPVAFMLGSLFCWIVAAFPCAALGGGYQDRKHPDRKGFVGGRAPCRRA